MPKTMTKAQLVDENIALRASCELMETRCKHLERELEVERAMHLVQSVKLKHHVAHSGCKTAMRTAYQETLARARETAMRIGKSVLVTAEHG